MFHGRVLFVSPLLETAFRPSPVVDLAGLVWSELPASATLLELFPLWLSTHDACATVNHGNGGNGGNGGVWTRRSGWRARGLRAGGEGKALNQGR